MSENECDEAKARFIELNEAIIALNLARALESTNINPENRGLKTEKALRDQVIKFLTPLED